MVYNMGVIDQPLKMSAGRDPKVPSGVIYWYHYRFINGEFYYLVCQGCNQVDPYHEVADTGTSRHPRAKSVLEFVLRKIQRNGKTKRVRSFKFSSRNKRIVPSVDHSAIVDEGDAIYLYIVFSTPRKIYRFDITREYVLTRTSGWDEVESTTAIEDMLLDNYNGPHAIRQLDGAVGSYPIDKKYLDDSSYGYVMGPAVSGDAQPEDAGASGTRPRLYLRPMFMSRYDPLAQRAQSDCACLQFVDYSGAAHSVVDTIHATPTVERITIAYNEDSSSPGYMRDYGYIVLNDDKEINNVRIRAYFHVNFHDG